MRLDDIARRFDLSLCGDAAFEVVGVCALQPGRADCVTYLSDARHAKALPDTVAGAVILAAEDVGACPVSALVAEDPALAYARVAALFDVAPPAPGIDPAAVIAATASVHPQAWVAAGAIVADGARIAAHAVVDSGAVIGAGCTVGEHSRIGANVVLHDGVTIGSRVHIEPAAVIGARGFGLVRDGHRWQPIPQLGSVIIGDDVEIGAGCTIDRGAIADTVIEEGVKLDDQVHIAHNCRVGAHTVIAGCAGLAGSAVVGRNCLLGGGVRVGDHVRLCDGVILAGATQVPKNIDRPGVYSSTLQAAPARQWHRSMALLRRLAGLDQRLRRLERDWAVDKGETK
ncbi:MAG: UDP-3-O-(3-hydroxymyristoyl)glucosamine N-acyltransferase [Salinisphaera sp.]|nr:UDP-3-O-(3-hydroxymyristoyl)glucosamine N-acyltransferase [Salinisphaera sp.]